MLISFVASFFLSASAQASVAAPEPDLKFVEQTLKSKKFKPEFIEAMKKNYNDNGFIDVLRLNVLLFLKKADYHGPQVTADSAVEVSEFIKANRKVLDVAEQKYQVPAEVIVSLIWMESRLGRSKGTFHVPSVYLDLIQARRKPVIAYLKTQTDRFTDKVSKKQLAEISVRAVKKSDWALGELKSIQKVFDRKWDIGENFKGSFAGAFGLPQFIPSSYVLWARPLKEGTQPVLSNADDAIMSVAFYLKTHGRWKSSPVKKEIRALMSYNNSRDYANAILDLAARTTQLKNVASVATPPSKRAVLPADSTKPEKMRERLEGDSFKP